MDRKTFIGTLIESESGFYEVRGCLFVHIVEAFITLN